MPEIPKPLRTNRLSDAIPLWYDKFVDVDLEQVYDLISIANFLNVPELIELGCAKVGSLMKGKRITELR